MKLSIRRGETMEKEYFIKSELAERWGVSRQVVNNWAVRRKDFPRQRFDLGVTEKKMPVYHIRDIEVFEEKHHLIKGS